MNRAADRIFGVALIGLAAFIAVQTMQLHVPFSYDPLGPKAFPMALSALLAFLAVFLIIRPGQNEPWPRGLLLVKMLAVLGVLVVCAMLFTRIGYLPSTAFVVAALSLLYGASLPKSLLGGVLMSIGSYYLFSKAMGIPLPPNGWFEGLL